MIRAMEFRSRGSALPYVQTFDLPHNRYRVTNIWPRDALTNVLTSIRGHVHLIPGHPSINTEANALFRDYQRQAACGEIQFRRWPLRAVSSFAFNLHHTGILTPTSINVWFYVTQCNPCFQRPLDRQRTAVVELLLTEQ